LVGVVVLLVVFVGVLFVVVITVIVPEAVSTKWYHRLLQENVAQQLKTALGMRPNVVVTNVKYFLK
jgi:small-conductance mechanosensitive channel